MRLKGKFFQDKRTPLLIIQVTRTNRTTVFWKHILKLNTNWEQVTNKKRFLDNYKEVSKYIVIREMLLNDGTKYEDVLRYL